MGGQPIVISGPGVSVSITSSGAAPAILDAQYLSRHFVVSDGARLTLRNVEVVNGYMPGVIDGGGSIKVNRGSALRLYDVTMKHNRLDIANTFFNRRGGAVFAYYAAVNISGGLFVNNTATCGGAVAGVSSTVHVSGTTYYAAPPIVPCLPSPAAHACTTAHSRLSHVSDFFRPRPGCSRARQLLR